MGSSGEDPNKAINGSVCGLVWVQRRNGCWWPGKILGPDELPEGSVPAPGSGTPVQLLGRDDASVDWYNLEKSKRIKAFHCGDYDHCIEKVKASAFNNTSKKAPKNATRDGAILHALELESAYLSKNHPDLDEKSTPSEFYSSEEESEDSDENSNSSEDDSDLASTDSKEENAAVGSKRMRGLEDLGINMGLSLKRKTSQISENQELLLLKRKDRRRALTKVLERTSMVSVPVGEKLSSPNGVSFLEGDESKKNKLNENFVPENESFGRLFDVPLVAEEKQSTGFPSFISDVGTQSSQSSHVETLSNESGSTISGGHVNFHISPGTEKGNPEWRSKGKRNSRSRKVDLLDEAETQVAGPGRDVGPTRLLPYRQSRFTVNPKYDPSDFSLRPHHTASPSGGGGLYDVPLEVKASYRSQSVPYISLVSKLTGQPIVGHPLAIEALDDGSCDAHLISVSGCYYSNPSEHGDGRVHIRKLPSGRARNKHRARGLMSRSLKSTKNGLLSKKTRKLSSLSGARRLMSRDEKKRPLVEKVKGPCIACVPLNVVFSRINADLSGSVRSGPRPVVVAGGV
ncbi:uncharacterized protein at1g51745 [Phtheirospermum japonicum]|uniref:Uncharacterized protein at1g51745 n=1 Tax=Phtheirospermum japonicum TaxID=374723 RepID=A0A830BM17_9LAMI|nr:uncharacterized protein at1g51745 [Phtheirospermum japonicum]